MKKIYTFLLVAFFGLGTLMAQFQLNTVPPLNGGNGNAGISFGLTSTQTIIIDTIFCTFNSGGLTDIWYTTTDLTGPPNITTSNGWTQIGQATVSQNTNGAGSISPIPINVGLVVLPNTGYRFYINGSIGAPVAYTSGTPGAAAPFTDGTITIETGANVGYGGAAPNPTFTPRQFNGGVKYSILGGLNDAAALSVDSPGVFCGGAQNVYATIGNFGSNQIDSVDVNWEIAGVLQPVIKYTTLLDTLNGTGNQFASVFLGSVTFPSGSTNIRVWTSNPNGVADTSNFNDTTSRGVGPSIQGALTVNPSAPLSGTNFHTISSAVSVINSLGLCGPASITVSPGLYPESVYLGNVVGADSINTLTIDGGNSSTTTIDGSGNYYSVAMEGSKYVSLKNFTIRNNGTSTMAVIFGNGAEHNTVSDCEIKVNPSSTSSLVNAIGMSASLTSRSTGATANYNTIENNRTVGGYYGIYCYGSNATKQIGTRVIDNQIDSAYYYGVYGYYQDQMEVSGNHADVSARGNTNADGFYGFANTNGIFTDNYFHAIDYGFYISNGTTAASPTFRKTQIINNMIISDTDYGMYLYSVDLVNLFHNSITASGTFNPALQIGQSNNYPISNYDMRNNIFAASSTEALEILTAPDTIFIKSDNNAYYTASGATLIRASNTNYIDLASYQLVYPLYNTASIEGDPQFLSATDLHIIGGFVNDVGDNSVGVLTDIDGDTRPFTGSTIVDIGADEFSPPTCLPVSNLSSTNATLTSADIYWSGNNPLNSWQYEIITAGNAQGTGTTSLTAVDSLTVTGLTPSTSYAYYVREICGRGDTSLWIGPHVFNTSNGLPYAENFESFPAGLTSSPFPNGWTSVTGSSAFNRWESEVSTGSNVNSFGTGPLYDHTQFGVAGGIYMYMETSSSTTGDSVDLISPPVYIDTSVTAFQLSYWYFNHGANIDRMEVWILSNGVKALVGSYVGQQQLAQSDLWLEGTHAISGYAGQSVQVIFRGIGVPCCSGDIAVDDIRMFVPAAQDGGVTDIFGPGSGCGLGTADTVTVEISNNGTAALSNFPVTYVLNSGTPVTETYTGSLAVGGVANFSFNTTVNLSVPGTYDLVVYTDIVNDGDTTNDTSSAVINSIPVLNTFPYTEGFETGNGGWVAGGTTTFALGTPAGTIINSAAGGTQAWVTNLTGVYNNNEEGYVQGPCFDFTNIAAPQFKMNVWWNSENSWDGAVLQSSIDGGTSWQNVGAFGDPNNWYTDNSVNGLANIGSNQDGWTGRNSSSNGSGGWVLAEHDLIGLGGNSGVLLRVVFGADGSVQDEGFAFDNVLIQDAPANDVGVVSIDAPISGCNLSAADTVKISISNFGSSTAMNFPVSYVFNAGTAVTETFTDSIQPGDTAQYIFTTATVNVSTFNTTYTLEAYSAYAGDGNPLNDTLRGYTIDNNTQTFPLNENFDALGSGQQNTFSNGWLGTNTSTFAWRSNTGGTPSSSTGPLSDHTTGSGTYMYTEASSGSTGSMAWLESPCIDLSSNTTSNLRLSYWYHMYGATISSLIVEMDSLGTWVLVDTILGQQQLANSDPYYRSIVDVSSLAGLSQTKLRFAVDRGTSFTGDVSIDDVVLDDSTTIGLTNELKSNAFNLYPNPSNGEVTLTLNTESSGAMNVNVKDISGKVVYQNTINVNGSYRNTFDFSDFAKGVYFMQIQTGDAIRVEKLIIQ